ncbi:lysozyme [Prauserella oleivorans]|uniref:Lysozyme n=1 Tax=Prauserella oleivorans TaxID=1478153 RepID=A0ABW5W9X9_9PSEU
MTAAIRRTATRAGLAIAALAVATLGSLTLLDTPSATADTTQVPGIDVSGHQGNVDWRAAWASGARFAYVKATEGTGYRNPYFAQQYNGSYEVGMIRGAYHFARPDISGGAAQADYFVAHGGGWTPDGKTLPPMLDIEYNPYGPTCYGLSRSAMVDWIRSFSRQVHAKTGRWPMLYTTTDWWRTCTGDSPEFGETHPLFIARYADNPGPLPSGWRYYTMWQYSDSGRMPGDQDTFNGSIEQLIRFATGDTPPRAPVTTPPPPPTTTPPPPPSSPSESPRDVPPSSSTPPPTTTSPPTSTPPSTSTAPSTTESPAPSSTPETSTEVAAPTTTTTAHEDEDESIDGLVWAGQRESNPPHSWRADENAGELTARTADDGTAESRSGAETDEPAPDGTAHAQDSAHGSLANTGADLETARMVVFAAALILLGTILITLTRATVRR